MINGACNFKQWKYRTDLHAMYHNCSKPASISMRAYYRLSFTVWGKSGIQLCKILNITTCTRKNGGYPMEFFFLILKKINTLHSKELLAISLNFSNKALYLNKCIILDPSVYALLEMLLNIVFHCLLSANDINWVPSLVNSFLINTVRFFVLHMHFSSRKNHVYILNNEDLIHIFFLRYRLFKISAKFVSVLQENCWLI